MTDHNTGDDNTGNWNTGKRNTGYRNTGDYNTGNWNTGDWNTGNWNTGDRNTGNCNTGDWNTGEWNTGSWNTGDGNTGDRNTGEWNTGSWNTGEWNTGSWNTGDGNTGSWNTGDRNTGCFNTITPGGGYYFNEWLPHAEWDRAPKPSWLYAPRPTTWVNATDMTDEEKVANPEHKTTGGYLRVNDMKDQWRKAYEAASPEDREAVKRLPSFDADVFLEITGLDLREGEDAPVALTPGMEVEIDGVTYVLAAKGNT